MQSLFSQQSLENFSFTECCLRQLPSCHQTRKNQETSARRLLVSHLSPVGFSFFMTQKSSQTGWGAGSSSAPPSVLSSAASSSSGKYLVLVPGLLVSGGPDGAMNPALSSPGLPCSGLLCACLLSRNGFSCVLFQESQTGERTS